MSTVAATHEPRRERPPLGGGRGRLVVLGALLALAAIAWFLTDLRMAGMDGGPGTDPGAFGFYVTTWVVMMAAMMFPSIAPMVLMYGNLQAGHRAQGRSVHSGTTALFVGGYLLLWGASGLLAYGALKLGRAVAPGFLGWHHAGRWVVVSLLVAAALYELTPLKNACLTRCRSPLGFLVGSWHDGPAGALRMGATHGTWCLGCCWLLMVVLFALGAMSLTWMIVVTLLIAAEKLLPRAGPGTAGVAAVLAALAVGVAAAPRDVPGLTIPGAMHTMAGAMAPTHRPMALMHRAMPTRHGSMAPMQKAMRVAKMHRSTDHMGR
jgi:predicted metal-binding membrane protein